VIAALHKPPPVEPTVTIEMSMREAQILRALVGGIDGAYYKSAEAGPTVVAFWKQLAVAADPGSTETFSDLFEGSVRCK
jgi:hypothetical protein